MNYIYENMSFFIDNNSSKVNDVIKKLNELGQEGWEVATCIKNKYDCTIFFLKRRVEVKKSKK